MLLSNIHRCFCEKAKAQEDEGFSADPHEMLHNRKNSPMGKRGSGGGQIA